jgi:hypothetical protein
VVGTFQLIELTFDAAGDITSIVMPDPPSATPPVRVLEFTAPAGAVPGILTLELDRIGHGLGFPNQEVQIPEAPLADDTLDVRSHEPTPFGTMTRRWEARDDLDAATPTDAAVAVDHALGTPGPGARGPSPTDR